MSRKSNHGEPASSSYLVIGLASCLKRMSMRLSRTARDEFYKHMREDIERLSHLLMALARMIEAGCETMHPEFMYRFWSKFHESLKGNEATPQVDFDRVMVALRLAAGAADELYDEYKKSGGARKETTNPELVLRLAHLYEQSTSRTFTHSPYKGYANYIGDPTSDGGKFVEMVMDSLGTGHQRQLSSQLRQVIKRLKDSGMRELLKREFS